MKHCFTNAEQKKINIIKDTFLDSWEKKMQTRKLEEDPGITTATALKVKISKR